MLQELRSILGLLVFFTLVLGLGSPLLSARVGQALFPHQANGSLIETSGAIVGSELIGQNFSFPKYFHPRPSAAGNGYDAADSSASNLPPTSEALIETIGARVADLRQIREARPIPIDLVTASGSGLDPDISVASAQFQVPRIAEARGLPPATIDKLIAETTTPRTFGVFGENRVNVLKINMALDALPPPPPAPVQP